MKDQLHFIAEGIHSQQITESLNKRYAQRGRCQQCRLPSLRNLSACKRLNVFLKWMVRKVNMDLAL